MRAAFILFLLAMIGLALFVGLKLRRFSDEIGHVPDELDDWAGEEDAQY
jgi:hypothetical protein